MCHLHRATVLAALAVLLLAGCGGGSSSTAKSSGSSSTTAVAAKDTAAVQLKDTSLGQVLVDGKGMTLYMFTKDSDGKSACSGPCASTWAALTVTGAPGAGKGIDHGDLGTIKRDDGATQVTYYGHPLYRYGPDNKPGDVNGHGVGGVWFAVRADGTPAVKGAAPVSGY